MPHEDPAKVTIMPTQLYHQFPLDCINDIKKYVIEYMNSFDGAFLYVENIKMPDDVERKINLELKEYGLPEATTFVCFKRKMFLEQNQVAHVDYSNEYGIINCALIVPVEGCSDTNMYWMDGDFTTQKRIISASSYLGIIWQKSPTVIDSVEIDSVPYLTRVSIPHSVTSRRDGSYRTIVSIRFKGNPSFDEMLKSRFGK